MRLYCQRTRGCGNGETCRALKVSDRTCRKSGWLVGTLDEPAGALHEFSGVIEESGATWYEFDGPLYTFGES